MPVEREELDWIILSEEKIVGTSKAHLALHVMTIAIFKTLYSYENVRHIVIRWQHCSSPPVTQEHLIVNHKAWARATWKARQTEQAGYLLHEGHS